eukprot:m.181059 g.181059  ORF g.181059 m.181059 type:complete len:83 (-) comp25439_c3_seq4:594-842(-)
MQREIKKALEKAENQKLRQWIKDDKLRHNDVFDWWSDGMTPLLWHIRNSVGNVDTVDLLVQAGADVNYAEENEAKCMFAKGC